MTAVELAERFRANRLSLLAKDLEGTLVEDKVLVSRMLRARHLLMKNSVWAQTYDHPRLREKSIYEFSNAFARFYISARNSDADTPAVFAPFYDKLVGEIQQKGMTITGEWSACASLEELWGRAESIEELNWVQSEVSKPGSKASTQFSCDDLKLVVPAEVKQRMLERATEFTRRFEVPDPAAAANQIFLSTAQAYLPASGGLYWGFGPEAYEFTRGELGAILECYASPFNHSLPVFCSPIQPLDCVYGSLCSFYENKVVVDFVKAVGEKEPAVIVANPPYIEAELQGCSDRLAALGADPPAAGLRVVSIFPKWDGAGGVVGMEAQCSQRVVLEPEQHAYYDYQTGRFIPARFASLGFVLGWPKNGEAEQKCAEVFKLLAHGGKRSKKRRTQ
mmetsp:Transcript_23429/g.52890  ORF Transcript_23429/g.52890 Transcript_23429/m.52890 type:complete len:392 (+) Transcript_23429:94-1269(+)